MEESEVLASSSGALPPDPVSPPIAPAPAIMPPTPPLIAPAIGPPVPAALAPAAFAPAALTPPVPVPAAGAAAPAIAFGESAAFSLQPRVKIETLSAKSADVQTFDI